MPDGVSRFFHDLPIGSILLAPFGVRHQQQQFVDYAQRRQVHFELEFDWTHQKWQC